MGPRLGNGTHAGPAAAPASPASAHGRNNKAIICQERVRAREMSSVGGPRLMEPVDGDLGQSNKYNRIFQLILNKLECDSVEA